MPSQVCPECVQLLLSLRYSTTSVPFSWRSWGGHTGFRRLWDTPTFPLRCVRSYCRGFQKPSFFLVLRSMSYLLNQERNNTSDCLDVPSMNSESSGSFEGLWLSSQVSDKSPHPSLSQQTEANNSQIPPNQVQKNPVGEAWKNGHQFDVTEEASLMRSEMSPGAQTEAALPSVQTLKESKETFWHLKKSVWYLREEEVRSGRYKRKVKETESSLELDSEKCRQRCLGRWRTMQDFFLNWF